MIDNKEKKIFSLVFNQINSKKCNMIDVGGFEGDWTDMVIDYIPSANISIIEPNFKNFEKLLNKYTNNQNIRVLNAGASNKTEALIYYDLISDDKDVRGMSGFVFRDVYKKYNFKEVKIQTITIDELGFDEIDFIKIDTEGFEFNVICGCKNLLSKHKIKFLQFEYGGTFIDSKLSLNDIVNFLAKFEYYVYDIKNSNFLKLDKVKNDDYLYNNFLVTYNKLEE